MVVKPGKMSHCGVHFTVFTLNNSFFLLAITRMVSTYSSCVTLYAPFDVEHLTDYDHPLVASSPYTAEHYAQILAYRLSLSVSSNAARAQQHPNMLMASHHCYTVATNVATCADDSGK